MYITISTTSDCKKTLNNITKKILSDKLSPCIQRYKKIESTYAWKDKIENNREYKIDIKTITLYEKNIFNLIKKMHNYDIPEIISFEIKLLNKEYEEWFNKCTKK